MKSGKQRKEEIKAKRLVRLAKYVEAGKNSPLDAIRFGAVAADHTRLRPHNSYDALPEFYMDCAFVCKDCGSSELWTAKQQKWWYEIAKGPFGSRAVRCKPCRAIERARADEARRVSLEGMQRKLAAQKLKA
jgi:Probable zinc-ribbon domain